MKTKKILACLIASTMLLSMVACDSEPAPSSSAPTGSSTASTGGDTDELPPIEELDVEFTIGTNITGTVDLEESLVMKKVLEELPNVDIDFTYWSDVEPRNLAFQTGNYPEAVMGHYVLEVVNIAEFSQSGMLAELGQYVSPELTPNIQRAIDEVPDYWNNLKQIDGNVYHIASVNGNNLEDGRQVNDTWWINSQWLDAVGKEVPTTLDELYDVLVAFDEAGDLNGNGKDDEIPLGWQFVKRSKSHFASMTGAWGLPDSGTADRPTAIRDGELVYVRTSDAWKNSLLFANKLYSEGLVEPEMFTLTNDMFKGKYTSNPPVYGAFVGWTARDTNTALGVQKEESIYVPVYPMKATADSEDPKWWWYQTNVVQNIPQIAITEKAIQEDEVVDILRFFDYWLSPENSIMLTLGEEGVHWESIGNNQYDTILKEDGSAFSTSEKMYVGGDGSAGRIILPSFYDPIERTLDDPKYGAAAWEQDYIFETGYHQYLDKDTLPATVKLTAEEQADIVDAQIDLEAFTIQSAAKFVTEGGIEEGWDEYLSDMNDLGLQEVMDTYSAAYDRWLAVQ